ncbi:MAG: hypothetical protein C0592_06340 [Marinilabiliales bacterium]|nr:MAG: hypothetical protein C0592_06340 [Marinilabiliales bacterium]
MKKILLFLLFASISAGVFSQFNSSFKKKYEIADNYIYDNNFIDALPLFLELENLAPNNPNIQFHIGVCYLHTVNDKAKSIPYLEKASQSISVDYYGDFKETTAPVFTFYYLGKAYHLHNEFDLAIENYNKFRYYLTTEDTKLMKDVDRQIEMAYNAKKLIEFPITIRKQNLGEVINSTYPDYSPVMAPDMTYFIFTSRREGSTGGEKDQTGKYFEDLYIADYNKETSKFSNLRPLPGSVNTDGHEASISVSWDGQFLFIYKDDDRDGNIYMSQFEDGAWSTAEKMPNEINTKNYENHACLSPDGEKLYFLSDRPGGFGGKDIWVCKKIGNNKWSEAENLGPRINTEWDEESPVLLSDGKTLYFSSKGHESMGGYDIFFSIFEDGEWSYPQNIGYPLNTSDDDVFFVPTLDGREAYYSSITDEGTGEMDIYRILITSDLDQLAILSGEIKDTVLNQAIASKINVYDFDSGELYSQTNTDKEGHYKLTLEAGKKYKLVVTTESGLTAEDILEVPYKEDENLNFYKPYYFTQSLIAMETDTLVNRINVGQRMGDRFVLRNVYFDFDKSTLRPESTEELDRLVALLNALPEIKIELSGHTDNRGSASYNKQLSEDRAKAVVDYLIQEGIEKSRLTYVGFGFDQPIATNETDAGRQLNRRVEFRITSTSGNLQYDNDSNLVVINNQNRNLDPKYNDVVVDYQPRWHIIGGSFMFLKNAEKFKEDLIRQGYTSAEIVGQNSTGSYRVAYASYLSKDRAMKEMHKLKGKTDRDDLWLLQK